MTIQTINASKTGDAIQETMPPLSMIRVLFLGALWLFSCMVLSGCGSATASSFSDENPTEAPRVIIPKEGGSHDSLTAHAAVTQTNSGISAVLEVRHEQNSDNGQDGQLIVSVYLNNTENDDVTIIFPNDPVKAHLVVTKSDKNDVDIVYESPDSASLGSVVPVTLKPDESQLITQTIITVLGDGQYEVTAQLRYYDNQTKTLQTVSIKNQIML